MITREVNLEDWEKLSQFFLKIYRKNHPLQNRAFWEWQYGDKKYGRSFVCFDQNEQIVGHVGASFSGGLAWIINVYLEEEFRGKGILNKLYNLSREYFPLAATAANKAGLGLYRNMRWIRYHNLVRYVKLNPMIENPTFENICKSVNVEIDNLITKDTHYFRQPFINGIILNDQSTAISQKEVGGLRIVSINNLEQLESQCWDLGFLWMDYITSWNDLKIKNLEKSGWVQDFESVVPWHLNPIEKDSFCEISFLSEFPLDNEFIVHRNFSDHGRIGSLILQ